MRFILISLVAAAGIGLLFLWVWHRNDMVLKLDRWIEAVLAEDTRKLKDLLDAGVDVDTYIEIDRQEDVIQIEGSATALIIFCAFGDRQSVQLLLHHGADVNAQDGMGRTPVYVASMRNDPGLIEVLVIAGADLELSGQGVTPLIGAAAMDRTGAVKSLIRFGANVNAERDLSGTALMEAAVNGSEEIARSLLEAGADVDIMAASGGDAFLIAAGHAHVGVIEVLLEFGADPTVRTENGYTALMYAAGHSKSADAVRFLLEMGADPNGYSAVRGWKGNTALHEAAAYGTVEIITVLLEAGADPLAATEHGFTPLSEAERRDDDLKAEIVAVLKEAVAKRRGKSQE